ncbi:MAG: peptide chain release factor N(5)-glutamine methyltransferase [Dehalococcoidales bacterium]|nr:peptide chain release factor N(5)-glutamine methyltransferase [Dehalococcoidales bacterium]
MTLKEYLKNTREVLKAKSIDAASLEGEILVRQVMNFNRVQLYQSLERQFPPDKQELLQTILERRLQGEPAAYITGEKEFYGLVFYVNKHVLIPRPETEHLVDKVISLADSNHLPVIADIGTGSGAIAISLALHLTNDRIFASDISTGALKVAGLNCHRHGVTERIKLLYGDLLETLPEKADIIVANLPYVRTADISPDNFEPLPALDGGEDGLDLIRRLCYQVKEKLNPNSYLLIEIGLGQKDEVITILNSFFPPVHIEVILDLRGIDRVICASFT